MAVFTELTDDEVRAFVAQLHAGELQSLQPVHAGIENTNYFVTTSTRAVGADAVRTADAANSCRSTCG